MLLTEVISNDYTDKILIYAWNNLFLANNLTIHHLKAFAWCEANLPLVLIVNDEVCLVRTRCLNANRRCLLC